MAVLAQLRVATILENTRRKLDYTRSQGRGRERPTLMTPERVATVHQMRHSDLSYVHLGKMLGASS